MERAGEQMAEGWFQMMRLIKSVGNPIIDFLEQIENFQKMLWEKRKFVTETHYCITLRNIGSEFYSAIAANEEQWAEWQELFGIEEKETERRVAMLPDYPTLMLHTKHFERSFVDKLLGQFRGPRREDRRFAHRQRELASIEFSGVEVSGASPMRLH